jgi:hypothetical protein
MLVTPGGTVTGYEPCVEDVNNWTGFGVAEAGSEATPNPNPVEARRATPASATLVVTLGRHVADPRRGMSAAVRFTCLCPPKKIRFRRGKPVLNL